MLHPIASEKARSANIFVNHFFLFGFGQLYFVAFTNHARFRQIGEGNTTSTERGGDRAREIDGGRKRERGITT